jgi:predicted homoserine dehydrogenase-like protein
MSTSQVSRRTVLKIAASSSPLFIVSRVFGREGPGANERVNVGLIGLGGRCRTIAHDCMGIPEMRVVAVCDCFQPRIDAFQESVGKDQNWKTYTDFRRMIENE